MECIDFVCELCAQTVKHGDFHVRIGADTAVRKSDSEFQPTDNTLMVVAVFHNECVEATVDQIDCDEVQYIWLARQLVDARADYALRTVKDARCAPVPRIARPCLSVLTGGLSA